MVYDNRGQKRDGPLLFKGKRDCNECDCITGHRSGENMSCKQNSEIIMGLDVGEKTIGVAVSDSLLLTAQGKDVIKRKSLAEDIEAIKSFIFECHVTKVIIGLPKNMDGSLGDAANTVIQFKQDLEHQIDLPVETLDERLTTKLAEQALIAADVSRKKRKKVIDKMAAVQILQTYLDRRKSLNSD